MREDLSTNSQGSFGVPLVGLGGERVEVHPFDRTTAEVNFFEKRP